MAVERILKLRTVSHRTGLSAVEVFRLIGKKEFPLPVAITDGLVGWKLSAINRWIRERKVIPRL
jgi:prophage regulatory protein